MTGWIIPSDSIMKTAMIVSRGKKGYPVMKFSRGVAGAAGQVIIAADFTLEEKGMIREWLEMTLKLEFRSGSGHPLEGFIELQMYGFDTPRIEKARDVLDSDETQQDLTREEFGTLTRIADVWEDIDLTRLDQKVRENDQFLARGRYPEMRAYILSDAYLDEMKVFADIVPDLRRARRDIYPHERTVIEVDFEAGRITGG
ncbi:MAG: hypothetical protein JAZ11_00205 [Candidatus Thiodiazotropha lotti]|nr:hypothetical protein [Candidatus Thiodiazotropha lotti]